MLQEETKPGHRCLKVSEVKDEVEVEGKFGVRRTLTGLDLAAGSNTFSLPRLLRIRRCDASAQLRAIQNDNRDV